MPLTSAMSCHDIAPSAGDFGRADVNIRYFLSWNWLTETT